jgi:hypothetical protein
VLVRQPHVAVAGVWLTLREVVLPHPEAVHDLCSLSNESRRNVSMFSRASLTTASRRPVLHCSGVPDT